MKIRRPEIFFAITVFVLGTILLLITPAGANYDEETYMARIWEMSLGHIMPNSYLTKGDHFPNEFLTVSYRRQTILPVIDMKTFQEQMQVKIDWNDFIKTNTRAVYFPTLFMVQAFIMRFFGGHLHFPVLVLYFILRFSFLLIYCLLIYFTLKVLPFAKWIFGTLALAPMCLIQASSVSSDPVIFGIAFLFIAWILKLCADPNEGMTRREIIITCLLTLAVGTLKPNTIFLLVLLFIIPARKFAKNKGRIILTASALASLVLSLGWSYIASQYFISRDNPGVEPVAQFISIFTHPLVFIQNFASTISSDFPSYFKQAVGVSGYGNWLMPSVVYWVFPLAVLLAFFVDPSDIKLTLKQRIFFGLAGLFNLLMVFIIFYVVETPQGYAGIWGVQGRYFIPFFPLLLIPFLFNGRFHIPPVVNGVLVILITIVCVGTLFLDYHVVCGPSWLSNQGCTMPKYKNWDPNTFFGLKLHKDTRIRQKFVVQCNELSQISLWVNNNQPVQGQEEYFLLESMDFKPIQSSWIKSEDIPQNGWMTINLSPTIKMKNEELQFELLPKDKGGIPLLELGYFPTNEYLPGVLWINDIGTNSDMVFQITCLDGISQTLK